MPTEKIRGRYPRTVENLQAAIRELPHVRIYDNDDLSRPYRLVAVFECGRLQSLHQTVPSRGSLTPSSLCSATANDGMQLHGGTIDANGRPS